MAQLWTLLHSHDNVKPNVDLRRNGDKLNRGTEGRKRVSAEGSSNQRNPMIWFLKEFSKRLRSLDLLCPRAGRWITAPSPKDGLPRVAQKVKNLPAMQETWVRSLAWENPLEEEMATHCSILAWRIPQTEKPGGLQSMGLQRVGHDWATFTFPKRCPCPHTQNVLPLPAKKDFAGVIKLRI